VVNVEAWPFFGVPPSFCDAEVFTGPLNVSGNTGLFAIAAAPVILPAIVSVPDFGAAVAVLLLVLLPDDEHAPSPAVSAMAPAKTASFLMIPPIVAATVFSDSHTAGVARRFRPKPSSNRDH
jgi:hypothetical protein